MSEIYLLLSREYFDGVLVPEGNRWASEIPLVYESIHFLGQVRQSHIYRKMVWPVRH